MDPKAPPVDVRRDFKIHSGAVKAIKKEVDGKQVMYIEGIASSTVRDRHGDTITAAAQLLMLEKAKGLTMWLNHSYVIPEDVLGTCEDSELVKGADAEAGDVLDLVIRCRIDPENPRAVKSWRHVENGTQLAFSIGGNVTDAEIDEENDDGSSWCPPLIINGLDLYEISLVGIPANPRAYTRGFVQEMSRGFMRNAARNPEVIKHLRKALPALSIKSLEDPSVEPAIVLADPDETDQPPMDPGSLDHILEAMKCMCLSIGHGLCTEGVESTRAAHAHLMAALPTGTAIPGEALMPDGSQPMETSAHVQVEKLEPKNDDFFVIRGSTDDVVRDLSTHFAEKGITGLTFIRIEKDESLTGTLENALTIAQRATATMIAEKQTELVNVQLHLSEADAQLIAKQAEIEETIAAAAEQLEQMSSVKEQHAAEITTAETRITALKAEETQLQTSITTLKSEQIEIEAKIAELRATPTGRRTANPGGSTSRVYQEQTTSLEDARRRLNSKMMGVSASADPALRPA